MMEEIFQAGDIVKLRTITDDERESDEIYTQLLVSSIKYIDTIIGAVNHTGDRFVLVIDSLNGAGTYEGLPLSNVPAKTRGWNQVPAISFGQEQGLSEAYDLAPFKVLLRPGIVETKVGSIYPGLLSRIKSENHTAQLVDKLPGLGS